MAPPVSVSQSCGGRAGGRAGDAHARGVGLVDDDGALGQQRADRRGQGLGVERAGRARRVGAGGATGAGVDPARRRASASASRAAGTSTPAPASTCDLAAVGHEVARQARGRRRSDTGEVASARTRSSTPASWAHGELGQVVEPLDAAAARRRARGRPGRSRTAGVAPVASATRGRRPRGRGRRSARPPSSSAAARRTAAPWPPSSTSRRRAAADAGRRAGGPAPGRGRRTTTRRPAARAWRRSRAGRWPRRSRRRRRPPRRRRAPTSGTSPRPAGRGPDVGLERGVVALVVRRVVADDVDDRGVGAPRVVQVGEAVAEPGPEVQQRRGRAAGHPRVPVGRAGGHALEEAEHAAHLGHVVEGGHEVHLGGARVHEADVDAGRRPASRGAHGTVHRRCRPRPRPSSSRPGLRSPAEDPSGRTPP